MQQSVDAATKKGEYYKEKFRKYKCCVLIPTYNNSQTLRSVIDSVAEYTDDIIIVNDGSTDDTSTILAHIKSFHVLHHKVNQGKGIALRTGFEYAVKNGYDYAITIDSDGQHMATDLPLFIDKLEEERRAIIIGARNMVDTANVPKKSTMGNKISTFWFTFETGIKLQDTQSGFRLYPLYLLKNIKFFTWKYEFEIEVMVRAAWKGINVTPIPISVYYAPGEKRITHFRPFKDFTRVFMLNVVLVFIAVLYIKPIQLFKKIQKIGLKEFFKQNLLNSDESNFKKAAAVAVGIFMGIFPTWGFQMLIAVFLSFILKLNKVIVLVTANISIPPMIPFIVYFSFLTGGLVLNQPSAVDFSKSITLDSIWKDITQYAVGSICLATVAALVCGIITFLLLTLFRKKSTSVS
jgi:glycosyltransferase involved in cell wall biosynthesis